MLPKRYGVSWHKITRISAQSHRLVAAINGYSVDERQLILSNQELMNRIRDLDSVPATVTTASLLVGSYDWRRVAFPGDTNFGRYFVDQKIIRDNQPGMLPFATTMNCAEMILYSAYLAGEVLPSQIVNLYNRSLSIIGSISADKLFRNLGWSEELPDHQDFRREGSVNRLPEVGELIFFSVEGQDYPQHIAISLGGDLIISLHEANPLPLDPDPVRHLKISELPDIQYFTVQIGLPISAIL